MSSGHLFWMIFMGAFAICLAPAVVYLLVVFFGTVSVFALMAVVWICDKIQEMLS